VGVGPAGVLDDETGAPDLAASAGDPAGAAPPHAATTMATVAMTLATR
jgi:hypothetical protein